jgi:hypothetical protein
MATRPIIGHTLRNLRVCAVASATLAVVFVVALGTAHAANGDITGVRIASDAAHNGWTAEIDIENLATGGTYDFGLGTDNDPTSAKIVFTVTSPGYTSAGATTTLSRTVYGTSFVRFAYPTSTAATSTPDEVSAAGTLTVKVALSEFIYSGDSSITVNIASGFYTKTGTPNNSASAYSVTNNSTLAYPKAIGHFAVEQRRPVNGTQTVEVFAVQKFGMNNKPLAAVTVTATGASSSHTESGTATAMTLSSRGDSIPVYAVNLDLSTSAGFTRGELVNINFTAYPWVGNASSTLDATTDAGSQIYQLGPLTWTIMDKMIAVVDSGGGDDGTCAASLTQGTADASPCQTISGALTKIAAQNNSSYSLNRADGGEVQLKAGTYSTGKYSTQAVTNGYFTITPHSSTNRAGVVFDSYSTSQFQYAYERYYNVTFTRAANGYIVFAANPNVLILEGVNFTDAYGAWYSGDTNTDLEILDSTTTNPNFTVGGNDGHSRLNRHNTYTISGSGGKTGNPSILIGTSGSGGDADTWRDQGSGSNNIVIAYNKWLSKSDGQLVFGGSNSPITNMAIVNNLIERITSSSDALSEISDGDHKNLVLWYNSFAGQRFNHENDIVAAYTNRSLTNWSGKYNIFDARGDHRADLLDATTGMTGSWSIGYSVGWLGNHNETYSYNGDTDFWGLYSNTPTSGSGFSGDYPAGYTSNNSYAGSNAGNGDYHLTDSAAALNKVLSGTAAMPYDLEGNARYNNGSGAAGAYEYVVVAAPSTRQTLARAPNNLGLAVSWSFEDGRGARVTDFSGRGNSGTLSGSGGANNLPQWVSGKRGRALNFDGTDDYVQAASNVMPTNAFTLCGRVQSIDNTNYRVFMGEGDGRGGGGTYDWAIIGYGETRNTPATGAGLYFQGTFGGTAYAVDLGSADTDWHFLCGTWDGTNMRGYRDGLLIASYEPGAAKDNAGTAPFLIGAGTNPSLGKTEFTQGSIDDVRIYSRALLAPEIAYLYSSGAVRLNASQNAILTNGLIGLWSFDGADVTPSTSTDRSGSGYDGSIVGAIPTRGKIGQALSFDGTNDYVSTPVRQFPQTAYSATAWIKTDLSQTGIITAVYKQSGTVQYTQFYVDTSGAVTGRIVQTYDTTYIGRATAASAVTANAWTHVVMTWDGGTTNSAIKVYVNGSQADTANDGLGTFTAPNSSSGAGLWIGAQEYDGAGVSFFKGLLDDIRVYDRALSAPEVTRLYRAASARLNR